MAACSQSHFLHRKLLTTASPNTFLNWGVFKLNTLSLISGYATFLVDLSNNSEYNLKKNIAGS
jgi:hypothetical protein